MIYHFGISLSRGGALVFHSKTDFLGRSLSPFLSCAPLRRWKKSFC